MNSIRYFLPHIMALATNSPFWLGLNTGYKGYRAKVFENFPRTGIPDAFSSYSEFENYVSLLVNTNCIDNAKKIWWDIRPHPFFDTVEVAPATSRSAPKKPSPSPRSSRPRRPISTGSTRANQDFRQYARPLLMENKFRAVRYGLDGKLIDFGKQQEVPSANSSRSISPSSIPLSTSSAAAKPSTVSAKSCRPAPAPTASSKFLKNPRRDLKAVVDYIAQETAAGL